MALRTLIFVALLRFVTSSSAELPGLAVARERLRGCGPISFICRPFQFCALCLEDTCSRTHQAQFAQCLLLPSQTTYVPDAGLPLGAEPVCTVCFYRNVRSSLLR